MAAYTERLPGGSLLMQSDEYLKIGTDALLLALTAARSSGARRVCDLGCGCGAVLLRLCELLPGTRVTGLELLPGAAALCAEGIEKSGLSGRAEVVCGDMREADVLTALGRGQYDMAVCNPPYARAGSGRLRATEAAACEREDGAAPPSAVCGAAAALLKNGGALELSLRADRLSDYICALREAGLEPKRLYLVRTSSGRLTPTLLLRAVRGAKSGMVLGELNAETGKEWS